MKQGSPCAWAFANQASSPNDALVASVAFHTVGVGFGRIIKDVELAHDVAGLDAARTFLAAISFEEEVFCRPIRFHYQSAVMAASFLKCQCPACLHQLQLLTAARTATIANYHQIISSFSLWAAHWSVA